MKKQTYRVFGPFELVYARGFGGRSIDDKMSAKSLEEQIDEMYPDDNLKSKGGCYVFAIECRGALTPWYVGKAFRQELLKEALKPHQTKKYQQAINAGKRGKPVLFFIAKSAPGQKESMNDDHIVEMETRLTEIAVVANPALTNCHNRPRFGFVIDGVPLVGQVGKRGRRGAEAKCFATMMGIG